MSAFFLGFRPPRVAAFLATIRLASASVAGAAIVLGVVATTTVLAPSVRAADAPPFLPLADVRPGMVATVKTVLQGTDIVDLKVEILSVVHDTAPHADIILARGVGEPLGTLGVSEGMSGSPVYVDGKLMGAVSSTWSFMKQPMLGITPVQQMDREAFRAAATPVKKGARSSAGPSWTPPLAPQPFGTAPSTPFAPAPSAPSAPAAPSGRASPSEPSAPSGSSASAASSASLTFGVPFATSTLARLKSGAPAAGAAQGFAPLGAPLVLSGFDRRVVDLASELFAPYGLTVAEGGSAGHDQRGGRIEPGATLGVRLAGGDVDMTAIGTVTWVDGDKVHGWGHPFFQMGDVEMPLVTGYIHAVVPSENISFKLGSGADVVGTITNDRRSGIAGRLGVMPRLAQIQLAVTEGGATEHYHYEVVRDKNLTPVLVGLVSANSISAREGGVAPETVHFKQHLVLDDGRETTLETVFAGDQLLSQTVDLLSQAASVIVTNPFQQVMIDKIDAEIAYEPGIQATFLREATLADDTPEPGDVLRGTYVLRDYRGEESTHSFRIPLPESAREGRYLLLLADASTAEQYEAERDPRAYQPRSVDELLARIKRLKRTDELHIHLYRQSKGVLLDGRPLADLPPSRLAVMRSPSRSGNAAVLPAEIVYQEQVPLGKFVQGAQTILFEVRKEKP